MLSLQFLDEEDLDVEEEGPETQLGYESSSSSEPATVPAPLYDVETQEPYPEFESRGEPPLPIVDVNKAPEAYRVLTEDEEKMLYHINDFIFQLRESLPDKVFLIAGYNECGIKKPICTYLSWALLPYPEMFSWETCASFLADYLEYLPLNPPTVLPRLVVSPTYTMEKRRGTSLNFCLALCSLLLGAGYDAYVVQGIATRDVTLRNYKHREYEFPEEDTFWFSMFDMEEPPKEQTQSKYRPTPSKELVSRFEQKMAEEEALRERGSHIEETKVEEKPKKRRARPDPLDGRRYHFWILIKAGLRQVTKSFYIETSLGESKELVDPNYIHVHCLFNEKNLWVNYLPNYPRKELCFDFEDEEKWRCLLPTQPLLEEPGSQESLADKETERKLARILARRKRICKELERLTYITPAPSEEVVSAPQEQVEEEEEEFEEEEDEGKVEEEEKEGEEEEEEEEAEEEEKEHSKDEEVDEESLEEEEQETSLPAPTVQSVRSKAVSSESAEEEEEEDWDEEFEEFQPAITDMPSSWVGAFYVSGPDFRNKYPSGFKVWHYHKAIVECYVPNHQPTGLVRRVTLYSDKHYRHPLETLEFYANRKDRLSKRTIKGNHIEEHFLPGRPDCLKEYFYKRKEPTAPKELVFYHQARFDSLQRLRISPPQDLREEYGPREDRLMLRITRFGVIKIPLGAEDMRFIIDRVEEHYSRDPSLPADEDVNIRIFSIEERLILLHFHTAEHAITASYLELHKPAPDYEKQKGFELTPSMWMEYRSDCSATPFTRLHIYRLLQKLLETEDVVCRQIYQVEDMYVKLLEYRKNEEEVVQLEQNIYDIYRNPESRSQRRHKSEEKEEEPDQEQLHDVLAPYLARMGVAPTRAVLTAQEARLVYDQCLTEYQQDMEAFMLRLRNRYNTEREAVRNFNQYHQQFHIMLTEKEEQQYQKGLKNALLRLNVISQRMQRQKEMMPVKIESLRQRLGQDPRLAALAQEP